MGRRLFHSQSLTNIAGTLAEVLATKPMSIRELSELFTEVDETELLETLRKLGDENRITKDESGLIHWQKK